MSTGDMFGGFFAGIIGTVIGYPLDTIKTRMQTSSTSRGMLATGSHLLKHEGKMAFYKGVATPLLSLTILSTLNFTSYNYLKNEIHAKTAAAPDQTTPNSLTIFSAGFLCGPIAAVFSTPEHLLKTLMQIDNTRPQPRFPNSSLRAASMIVKEGNGVRALYVGGLSNLVRESTFLSIYFLSYETLKVQLSPAIGTLAIPVAGGLSGALGWFSSYPLDCIKSNIMVNGRGGIIEVGRKVFAEKGVTGLYSGLGPSITRSFLVSGSRFSAYEMGKKVYERLLLDNAR